MQYEGSIEENTQGVEVMRFKTQDMDLKGTENWEVVFDIVKGNEAGYFSVKTDPLTNEGILMLDKVLYCLFIKILHSIYYSARCIEFACSPHLSVCV